MLLLLQEKVFLSKRNIGDLRPVHVLSRDPTPADTLLSIPLAAFLMSHPSVLN